MPRPTQNWGGWGVGGTLLHFLFLLFYQGDGRGPQLGVCGCLMCRVADVEKRT